MTWDLQKQFIRHAREIDRFLRRCGHNAETAADIMQDTFLRVLASPPSISHANHNPKIYRYRVSRSLSINHLHRESPSGIDRLARSSLSRSPALGGRLPLVSLIYVLAVAEHLSFRHAATRPNASGSNAPGANPLGSALNSFELYKWSSHIRSGS